MTGRRRGKDELDDERNDRPLRLFRQRQRAGLPTEFPQTCDHLLAFPARNVGSPADCEDHVPGDGPVVHLRVCLVCGHVGCCDSSMPRHATAHAVGADHPVMQSAEAGENWRWCYVHELLG